MTNPTAATRASTDVGPDGGRTDRPVSAATPDPAARPALPGPYANPGSAWAPASAATPIRMEDLPSTEQAGPFADTAGSLVLGGAVATWMALPDVLKGRGARGVVKLALLGGVTAWVILRRRAAAQQAAKVLAPLGGRPRPHAPARGSKAWDIARVGATGVAGFAGLVVADSLGHQGAKFLAARGTPAPHTILGLAAGAATTVAVSGD